MPWVEVLDSDEVAPGHVAALDVGDHQLVAWRTTAGVLAVCDARCPHQWSHLASAGAVDGDELVCLSHFWRFDVEGHGSKLGMTGRRDGKAPVATFPVREVAGRIEVQLPADA